MPFAVTITLDDERIRGILCTAFEGDMTRQWCRVEKYQLGRGMKIADFEPGGKYSQKEYYPPSQLIPLVPGCALILHDFEDNKTYKLNLTALKRGLLIMSRDAPKHFADLVNGNDDSITGDVFVQCCVLGEVKYG